MRKTSWAFPVAATVVAASVFFSAKTWSFLASLNAAWWVVPLFASATSMTVLVSSTALGGGGKGIASALSNNAYLVPGPSLAVLNLVPMLELGPSPPPWARVAMLSILLASAWVFYRSTREKDE